jgi:hypothetical protein
MTNSAFMLPVQPSISQERTSAHPWLSAPRQAAL